MQNLIRHHDIFKPEKLYFIYLAHRERNEAADVHQKRPIVIQEN